MRRNTITKNGNFVDSSLFCEMALILQVILRMCILDCYSPFGNTRWGVAEPGKTRCEKLGLPPLIYRETNFPLSPFPTKTRKKRTPAKRAESPHTFPSQKKGFGSRYKGGCRTKPTYQKKAKPARARATFERRANATLTESSLFGPERD